MAQPFANTTTYENMGPSLLALVPPTPEDKTELNNDWPTIYEHLNTRQNAMRSWRWSWWAHWNVLAEYILPRRHHWVIVANRMWKGGQINNQIIDSNATLAMQICAAGLWSGLTSPSRPWFKLGIALPWIQLDEDGKTWIEDTEQRIYAVLGQSNFYTILAQMFQDVATFGTSPFIIYEDHEDVIRLYLPCVGEFFLAAGARNSVDVFSREFVMTVAAIVEMFGLENLPESIQTAWENGGGALETEHIVCHTIEPNSPLAGRGVKKGTKINPLPGIFVFREFYWLKGDAGVKELSRKGFNERPFMAARWSTVSNDPYGRSPGMDALGDVRQVQIETRRKGEFIEKGVRPPMGANPELKNEPASIRPGEITYFTTESGKKGFFPLFEPDANWLTHLSTDIDKVNARVDRCFFVDIFMAISRMEGVQPRNELELTKRDLERLQVLGPFIHMFETEVAGPAIERVMAILTRRKLLKPKPQSLNGVPLKLVYTSIMKLAQRAAESVALKDVLTTGAELTEAAQTAGLPSPLRIINLDEAMREYVEYANANPKILYTIDEVNKQDAAKAQQAQQMQDAQHTMAAVQAAQALGNAKTTPDTALGSLVGGGAQTGVAANA
jgi:hypothetical protein